MKATVARMAQTDEIIYAALVAAAEAGKPCPGGRALGLLLGGSAKEEYNAYRSAARLAEAGRIVIERREKPNRRRITIVKGGMRTDWSTPGTSSEKLRRGGSNDHRERPMPKMPVDGPWVGDCFGPHNIATRTREVMP